jgi:hypothetical protein
MIKIFEKYWGLLTLHCSSNQFELLPRLTIIQLADLTTISFGLMMLSLNLTIWGKQMRDFNKERNDSL